MDVKKIAVLSALVLVVFGCIFAAGCTDAGSTPAAEKTNGIVGTWEVDIKVVENVFKQMGKALGADVEGGTLSSIPDYMNYSYKFNTDGTGTYSFVGTSSPLTWKSLGDNKYAVTTEGRAFIVTHDPATDRIDDDSNMFALIRQA